MPIYEYSCRECGQKCEILVRGNEEPLCPNCQRPSLTKEWSVPASPATTSSSLPTMEGGCGRPQCGTGRCMGMG
ncbi:MAG: zinc ribbon domain-containing protein [Planctomycetes bacterium]|nr:zinc ribbon domain-containing protein [Planctomycetota bacterium]